MEMLKPPVLAACFCCSRFRPLRQKIRGERDAAKPPGRRVSVLGGLLLGDVAAHVVGLQPRDRRSYWRVRCGYGVACWRCILKTYLSLSYGQS